MKKIFKKVFFAITVLSFSSISMRLHAQQPPNNSPAQPAQNTTCEHSTFFCLNDATFAYDNSVQGSSLCNPDPLILWYVFEVSASAPTGSFNEVTSPDLMSSYTLYGPILTLSANVCNLSINQIFSTSSFHSTTYDLDEPSHVLSAGFYFLKLTMESCNSSVNFGIKASLKCQPDFPIPCENCIGSFAPQPGDSFLVSVWVKEDGAPTTKTFYNYPVVYIDFPNISASVGPFRAKGQIIDGWQRVEEVFYIPANATSIQIRLQCDNGNCFFDDIRIYPFDGSMKTYVYDPITLRLSAELDERNYATFYEYDEEGKLIRVKKETEKGIMTIQESKTSIIKQ